jgi:hypothetical protein
MQPETHNTLSPLVGNHNHESSVMKTGLKRPLNGKSNSSFASSKLQFFYSPIFQFVQSLSKPFYSTAAVHLKLQPLYKGAIVFSEQLEFRVTKGTKEKPKSFL